MKRAGLCVWCFMKGFTLFLAITLTMFTFPSCLTSSGGIKPDGKLPVKYREFRLDRSVSLDDPVYKAIQSDMDNRPSILALMRFYMEELKKDASLGSVYFTRLGWLFSHGTAKDLSGHFYGWTLVLKVGEHPYGGFLNDLWSATVADVSPWAGKIFEPATALQVQEYTDGFEKSSRVPVYAGINCFTKIPDSLWNKLAVEALTFWLRLSEAPLQEKQRFGYDRKGGLFVAKRSLSADPGNPDKEVFQLNYRWKGLNNRPPLSLLVDELVEIADGLYLGTLLFATANLTTDFDPEKQTASYRYQNFGYFLLMDESWKKVEDVR